MPIVRMRALQGRALCGLGEDHRIAELREDLKKIDDMIKTAKRPTYIGRDAMKRKRATDLMNKRVAALNQERIMILARIAALEAVSPSAVTMDWDTPPAADAPPAADTTPAPPLTTQDPANAYLPAPRKGPNTATMVGGGLVALAAAAGLLLMD